MQFGFSCSFGFWCFHLFHLFHGLAFPFSAKKWMDTRRIRIKFHITEVVIVLIYGLVPPVVTVILSNYQNNGVNCQCRSAIMLFYSQIVPFSIVFVIGLLLLFCSLWIVRKVSLIFVTWPWSAKIYNMSRNYVYLLGYS